MDVADLKLYFKQKLNDMAEKLEAVRSFRLKGQNKIFVKFLLSRITSFVEQKAGLNSSFEKYFHNFQGKPFEVEHIWADKFQEHLDEFQQEQDFKEFRNRIGGLILLPRGTNQSFSARPYSEKLRHYIKENLLAQSLSELAYQNNPNFKSACESLNLPFEHHAEFQKVDLLKRQDLYMKICEVIWTETNFDLVK